MAAINLKVFRKENGVSQQELANYLGIGQGYVSQMERGDRPIPKPIITKIMENKEWTFFAQGGDGGDDANHGESGNEERNIPLIPREAIAANKDGSPSFTKEQVEDYYNVREFKSSDFLIRVKGDAMCPKYSGGDLVACKIVKDIVFIQWGRIYAVHSKSQGVMVKRLRPSDNDENIRCVSENPKYEAFDVPKRDILMLALVVGSITME